MVETHTGQISILDTYLTKQPLVTKQLKTDGRNVYAVDITFLHLYLWIGCDHVQHKEEYLTDSFVQNTKYKAISQFSSLHHKSNLYAPTLTCKCTIETCVR